MLRALILTLALIVLPAAVQARSSPAFRSDRMVVTTRGEGPDVILIPGLASTSDVWART
eukprot:gene7774-10372_t